MKLTTLFRLRKPDGTDPVNIEDFNDNFDVIDEELGKRLESTGNASDMTTAFTQASTRTNLKTGEKISASFGKIMKWFADLKTVAFSGSYNDLSNKPSIPSGAAASQAVANNCTTTAAGSVLDARQGKVLMDKTNQLSSEILGKAPASDPTLTFQNVGGTGGRVELRKSGGNPYALSLVYTNPSGENTFHSLVDSDGSRLWVMPYELTEVKNSFQGGVDTLYNQCVSCGVTPSGKTPTAIAAAIQKIYTNNTTSRFSSKEVYRNSGWNDGNNYTSVFNSELYNKELYASLLVAVREHVNSGEGSTTTMNEVRYSPSTGEIFVDSVGCYAEHITVYYR